MVNVEWCLKFSFKHAGIMFHVYTESEADRDCQLQTIESKHSHRSTPSKTPESKLKCVGPSCCFDDA